MLPSYATQVINYNPIIQQALLDVARWAEQGIEPSPSTTYQVVDTQIEIPAVATDRGGVQPSVTATVQGQKRVETKVGETVMVHVVAHCPKGTGRIVRAELCLGEQVAFDIPVKYGDVGTYFPAIRLTSSRNGQNETFTQIRNLDRVDILVNSAGGTGAHGSLEEEFSTENLKHTLDMDFTSTFNCVKYTYPRMEATGGGSIINIASLAALRAKGPICYSAAKGAIQSLSRNLALRFGKMGIRVNTIYPGFIVTEMTDKIFEMPELEKKMRSESVLGLLGEIDDIAYCALYLASNEAKFVTGQDFVIDGGTIIK